VRVFSFFGDPPEFDLMNSLLRTVCWRPKVPSHDDHLPADSPLISPINDESFPLSYAKIPHFSPSIIL